MQKLIMSEGGVEEVESRKHDHYNFLCCFTKERADATKKAPFKDSLKKQLKLFIYF